MDAALLEHRRTGAYIINTARAEVMDYAALADARQEQEHSRRPQRLRERAVERDRGVCRHPVRESPACSARTTSAHRPTRRRKRYPGRDRPHHPHLQGNRQGPQRQHLATQTPATHMLVVRHRDKPGVLAHVFRSLRVAHLQRAGTESAAFRRRACRRRPHQSRRRPVEPGARCDAIRQRRHTGSAIGETWVNKHTQKRKMPETWKTVLVSRLVVIACSVYVFGKQNGYYGLIECLTSPLVQQCFPSGARRGAAQSRGAVQASACRCWNRPPMKT